MELVQKTKAMVSNVWKYWKKPKEGEYVSYKELTHFILGAGGSMAASMAGGNLIFGAGCLFVGAIYGLKMMDFVMLGFVNLILQYPFSPINMIMTDNLGRPPKKTMRTIHFANLAFLILGIACFFIPQQYFEGFMPAFPQVVGTKFLVQVFTTYWNMFIMRKLSPKYGKYRCWIVANIIPYVVCLLALVYFPFNTLSYHDKFWVMSLLFCVWGLFGSCFGQYGNMQNVISPNTNERTKIMSIGSLVYSLFPSIYNLIFPVLAAWAGGMTDIRTYKIVVPVLVIIFAPLSLFMAFGAKDRVVQADEHKPQVDMKKGFKAVLRNKYLWITNTSGWLGGLSAGAVNVVNMLIIYSMRKDWVIGLMATLVGTAYPPGMLLSPWLIKKFGKKRVTLFCKYGGVICSLASIAGIYMNSLVIIIASTYVSTMLVSVMGIATSSMNADIWDYQQYISGERLDGCMGIFGYLAAPITTFTALIIPTIYATLGFTSDWNILYDPGLRMNIFIITSIVSTIAGLISIIPFHFYDLTEKRHGEIIEELEQRRIEEESSSHAPEEQPSVPV